MSEHHIWTNKNYVLRTLKPIWDKLDLIVFESHSSEVYRPIKPETFEDLTKLLEGVDKVYAFNEVETNLHGAIAYDLIIKE
ncbi:MAG: hypothetical protein J6S67_05850 [Methanobrevibacter sp.]|nr:hypothetical protein [Methanobrevibacter sp.]